MKEGQGKSWSVCKQAMKKIHGKKNTDAESWARRYAVQDGGDELSPDVNGELVGRKT